MNYLGNVSILERGSAPAQAIIDRNARSMAERMANETKEELEKVMNRVENICRNFEMTDELYIDPSHNMEYVSDISELAEILKDQVKKKKYQAQVTIFVVGFQDVSAQKLKLLQQISEFFSESMKTLDDEEMPSTPDVDLLDLTYRVDETLDYARGLAQQLGELNQNIIDYLLHYAENKAKNKSAQGDGKGKKKLEKALQAAKDDMTNLSEKLLSLQADLEDKDEKLQQLYKQIEIKTLENQKYKSAAEIAKKNLLDSQALKEEIGAKDEKIKDMRQIISRLEIDLAQERHNHEQSINRLENSSLESQQKMLELQKGVDGTRMESNEAKWEMEKLHESQLKAVLDSHSKEIEELKQQHKEEIEKLMEEIDALRDAKLSLQKDLSDMGHGRKFDLDLSESTSSPSSRQLEHEKETDITTKKESRSGSRSSFGGKHKIKDKTKDVRRENSNVSSNSESEEIVQNKRSKSTLETVAEDFDTVFDLIDEDSWSKIPSQDIPARFNQYRKLSQNYINELQEKLQMTLARTHRKVETLKAQFLEHKNKWDTERNLLLDQVKQAQNLQNDAERETDTTLTQLESFISEQEKLEQEEARQRQEMMRSAELLNKISPRTNKTPSADDDLTKLMEQTDDAKALASSVAPSISKGNEAHNENKELESDTQSIIFGPHLHLLQEQVLKNLKIMMSEPEEKLPLYQHKILQFVRLALKILNTTKAGLDEEEFVRTLNVVNLASQLTQESLHLGIRPDSLFKTLATFSKTLLDEKENEFRLLLHDSIVDDGFSEISFDSGTEGEISISTLRDLPLLSDVLEGDRFSDKPHKIVDTNCTPKAGDESKSNKSETAPSIDAEKSPSPQIVICDEVSHSGPVEESKLEESSSQSEITVKSQLSDDIRQHSQFSQTETSSYSPMSEANCSSAKISDETQVDEDNRVSSGRSQQSLRSHYKSKIEETKKAALERKNKAAEITKSIEQVKKEEETLIDEDHEGYLKSFGYSVSGELLPEHPVVQEYLKTYHSNLSFKDALSKVLLDKDMMSASQCISDLEIALFNPEAKILPQLQKMTKSTVQVLDEIISLLKTVLQNERDGPVSSMINISRDPTFLSRDKTPDSACTPLPTRQNSRAHSSHRQTDSAPTDNADNDYLRDLQQQCLLLRNRLDESTKKHEEQLKHNTELMVEMQHTINGLQKELSTLGKAPRSRSVTPHLPLNQAPSPETSIMFTRLDAERNAKIMKKAVNDEKLDENKYKDAVSKMDHYISLPAQRLGEIVRKYLHHSRMKKIEEAVRKHKYLENDVFDCLDKMANLQSLRAKRWSDKMDELGTERLRMANLLMDTLDNIENESGIFLIKPMYSYCGRELLNRYNGKLSRPSKAKARSYSNENQRVGPVPTPASNIRTVHHELSSLSQVQEVNLVSAAEVDCVGSGVSGSALNWVGTSKAVWNASTSQRSALSDELGGGFHNTPRILELDINRMLIGQNNISSRLCHPLTDDRLVNASQNTLRTYVTVNRPAVQPKIKERPYSATGAGDSNAPPTTPQLLLSTSGLKRSSAEFPQIQSTSPLPPINKTRNISASSSRLSSDGVHFRHDRSHSGKTITTTTSDDE